jgi:LacI family transcriptional regulator
MAPERNRATQKDIAIRAGLSIAAVSMALKNHPSLPKQTIERVKEIAKTLKYAPDSALSALVAHRNRIRIRNDFSVIGLISNWSIPNEWSELSSAQEVIQGAKERAMELGYNLQHLHVESSGAKGVRLNQILKARGIRGLILAPFQHYQDTIDLECEDFSVVTIEKATKYPNFHHIIPNQFDDLMLCWEKLHERGYKRVGLVVMSDLAERWHHQWEAAHNYASAQFESAPAPIPILKLDKSNQTDRISSWLREHRPQAVISRCDRFFEAAKQEKLRVPEDIGYVSLNISDDRPGASGIDQNRKTMGSIAVDALNSLLLRNQRGQQDVATGTLVDGTWHEGDTLPARL